LLPQTAQRDAYVDLAIARVTAVQADGSIILDSEFAPPCLRFGASPWFVSFLEEVQGKLASIAEERAAFVAGKRIHAAADVGDLLILQLCNRYLAGARHLSQLRSAHPEELYRWLLELLAEASTYRTTGETVAPEIEAYRHSEPWIAFRKLMPEVQRILMDLARPERKAIKIPLRVFPNGVRGAEVQEKALFTQATFLIAVQAPVPPEQIRLRLPGQIKIGPAEHLDSIVRSAVPGIPIIHEATVPREIPLRRDFVYFRLDRNNDYWRRLLTSAGLAIHVTGDLGEGMEMECWAIRN
jgi:type VI secretion system protein ImpJ